MADSMQIIIILGALISFGIFYGVMSYVVYNFDGGYNQLIDMGFVTQDSLDHMNSILSVWRMSPAIFLIGLVLFTIERAKGTDLSWDLFAIYEAVLLMSIIYSVIWVFTYGMVGDFIINTLMSNPLISNVSDPKLNFTHIANVLINTMYWLIMSPAYIGSFLFMVHPILRQTDNFLANELDMGDDDDTTSTVPIFNYMQH